ncbi:hypothetical protein [Sulfurovum sp.]|uniref:hypothetical protein n=1 Tax=Sulfurovum sp. TaxID=1969726 RepID=UPI00356A057F
MWDGYIGQGVNADGVIPDPIVEPVVIIPQEVSMRQARLALLTIGKLAAIETAITAMAGIDGEAARIEWEYAQTIKRDHALLLSLQADVLAMTDAELDQLFIDASNL